MTDAPKKTSTPNNPSNPEPQQDIIEKSIGQFGKYQLFIFLTVVYCKITIALHQMAIIYMAPKVSFTCNGVQNKCPCSNPVFDKQIFQNTIVMQWNLICDRKFLISLTQALFQLGVLIGSITFGAYSDRYGRKPLLLLAVVFQIALGILTAFIKNYWTFTILRFFIGMTVGGTMVVSFVLILEYIGTSYRSVISVLYQIPFVLGHLMLPMFGYFFRDYSSFELAISMPSILMLFYFFVVPETARWLLARSRTEEAIKLLELGATWNKRPTENIRRDAEEFVRNLNSSTIKKGTTLDLFRTPNIRRNNLVMSFNWLTCSYCFYGISQYMGRVAGNAFINVAISALITLTGTIISMPLIIKLKRKTILYIFHSICSFCMLLFSVLPEGPVSVGCGSIGLVSAFIVFIMVYLYCSELFPTTLRSAAVGFSSMMARVGSMIAPFVIELRYYSLWIPPLAFGVVPIICICLTVMLPETKDCKLMTTIEEAENMHNRRRDVT